MSYLSNNTGAQIDEAISFVNNNKSNLEAAVSITSKIHHCKFTHVVASGGSVREIYDALSESNIGFTPDDNTTFFISLTVPLLSSATPADYPKTTVYIRKTSGIFYAALMPAYDDYIYAGTYIINVMAIEGS